MQQMKHFRKVFLVLFFCFAVYKDIVHIYDNI